MLLYYKQGRKIHIKNRKNTIRYVSFITLQTKGVLFYFLNQKVNKIKNIHKKNTK